MPMPSSAAAAAAHPERLSWTDEAADTAHAHEKQAEDRVMDVQPPGSTLPGHQRTWARIIRTLNRMNRNAAMNATKKQNSRSLPASTTNCSNQLLIARQPP